MSYKFKHFALLLCSICLFAACSSDNTDDMEDEYPWVINYEGPRQVEEKLFVIDDDKKLNEIPFTDKFKGFSTQLEEGQLQMDPFLESDPRTKLTVLNESDIQITVLDQSDEVILDTVVEYYIENDRLIIPAMNPESGLSYDPDNRELVSYFSYQGLFPGPNAVRDSFFHHNVFNYDTDSFAIWYDYDDPEYTVERSFPLDTYYIVLYHLIHK